jgi:hypothetical protein
MAVRPPDELVEALVIHPFRSQRDSQPNCRRPWVDAVPDGKQPTHVRLALSRHLELRQLDLELGGAHRDRRRGT